MLRAGVLHLFMPPPRRRYDNGSLLAIIDAASSLGFDDDHWMDGITSRLLTNIHVSQ